MQSRFVRLFLFAGGLFALTSCELPPREAWRVIQHDGLFPYLAIEWGKRPIPPYVRTSARTSSGRCVTCPVPRSAKSAAVVTPPAPSTAMTGMPRTTSAEHRNWSIASRYLEATGPSVSRSPVSPGSPQAVASASSLPEVSRRAVIPSRPAPIRIQDSPPKAREPKTQPVAAAKPPPAAKTGPSAPPAAAPEPKSAASGGAAKPAPTEAPKTETVPPPAPPAVTAELPYGVPVPGRPGLVNSPYAGKYQLVDVTGLASGQEVKCPYSGKLFRVPPSAQAASKVIPTEPPPAEGGKKP